MRVWYVTMFFPKRSETFACTEVRALARRGVEVSVHALVPALAYTDRMLEEHDLGNVEVSHPGAGTLVRGAWLAVARFGLLLELLGALFRWSWRSPKNLLQSLPWLPRILELFARLEQRPPDVLHLFWGHYPSLLALLVAKHHPRIVISMFLSTYDLTKRYGPSAPAARRADLVRIHAEVNRPALIELGVPADHIFTCYRGIEIDRAPARSASKIRRRVVVAGRLIAEKGVDEALEVFARLAAGAPDATLVVLGDGPERTRLKRLARRLGVADRVTFRGHVPYARVFEELAAAEVFLLLSRYEAERLPNAVKEAMLSGCVPIVSETPGIGELVTDGQDGFVVAPGDVRAAADRVRTLWSDPALASRLAAAAERRIREEFDVDRVMAECNRRWQELVTGKRGGT